METQTAEKHVRQIPVSLAAGIFLGVALFDALPEAVAGLGYGLAVLGMLLGLLLWWLQKIVLQVLQTPELPPLVAGALWLHSALEGIVTGLAFVVSRTAGWLVLTAMILHLLPEFFAAVALLRGAGARRRTSVLVPLVGFVVLFVSFAVTSRFLPMLEREVSFLIALSGGAFLYIGAVSFWRRRSVRTALAFVLGIVVALVVS